MFKIGYNKKWNYICKCGNTGIAFEFSIKEGKPRSCKICAKLKTRKVKINNWYNNLYTLKHEKINNCWKWQCKCKCGNVIYTAATNILQGRIKSCKQCANKKTAKRMTKHGMHNYSGYSSWKGIHSRCNNTNNPRYKDYGARGIKIHPSWQTDFAQFIKDMGLKPKGYVLDRINNNGNYEPSNCRWVSYKINGNNSRRNRLITYINRTMTVQQWAEFLLINHKILLYRLNKNIPLEQVFELE